MNFDELGKAIDQAHTLAVSNLAYAAMCEAGGDRNGMESQLREAQRELQHAADRIAWALEEQREKILR